MPTLPKYNSAALLTKTRRAVWDAIDNWQPLIDWAANCDTRLWKQRMEDDLNEILADDSSFFELPSITTQPGQVAESWETNRMAKFADQIVIVVKSVYLDQAEELSEMVWQAIWQAAPASTPTVSYIKAATGRLPKGVSIARVMGQVGKQKAWVFTLTISLEASQDPLSTILSARVAV